MSRTPEEHATPGRELALTNPNPNPPKQNLPEEPSEEQKSGHLLSDKMVSNVGTVANQSPQLDLRALLLKKYTCARCNLKFRSKIALRKHKFETHSY